MLILFWFFCINSIFVCLDCQTTCVPSILKATSNIKTFTTPFFESGNYPNNILVCWKISASINHIISLRIIESSIEYDSKCMNDFGVVYDGFTTSSKLLAKWCGSDEKFELKTSSNSALIGFISDENGVTRKGFKIEYVALSSSGQDDGGLTTAVIIVLAIICSVIGIVMIIICVIIFSCIFGCCSTVSSNRQQVMPISDRPIVRNGPDHVTNVLPIAPPAYDELYNNSNSINNNNNNNNINQPTDAPPSYEDSEQRNNTITTIT
ncbi:DgyrCDS12863 [Dimorphilus gyrociliatus]|uniref:DgyrCDS12863 n=1 Tax=Dimorphilus gyrociliatus TaxID=2664684 RepID=A0A7I8W903_9ANNE|nr:DgyrCDS12863 [Dimorphilus gyrociliatus]